MSDSQGVSICRETCRLCGSCVKACPSGAMSFTGRKISLERLLAELLKYEGYYRNFSGGVTASGGEPLLQSGFLTELFRALKERKISTAVDTSGAVPFSTFEKLLPYTDLILYDIKLLSPGLHREYTGQDNALVLANLERIASRIALGQLNSRLWIRTPLIPDATATEENISGIAAFIQSTLSTAVDRWELCAFNKACAGKYERLDRKWSFADKPLISAADAERFKALILGSGFDAEKVFFTGIYSQ